VDGPADATGVVGVHGCGRTSVAGLAIPARSYEPGYVHSTLATHRRTQEQAIGISRCFTAAAILNTSSPRSYDVLPDGVGGGQLGHSRALRYQRM
jgi:hypothetical protein